MSTPEHRDDWLVPTLEGLVAPGVLDELRRQHGPLWEAAVRRGATTDDAIVAALAARYRIPVADLSSVTVPARDALGEALARKYRVVPLALSEVAFDVATANPNDLDCERTLAFATGRAIRMQVAAPDRIAARIEELYQPEKLVDRLLEAVGAAELETLAQSPALADFEVATERASARPIIRLVDHILAEGITRRASDIHLEVQEHGVQVVLRVDGVLRPVVTLPRSLGTPLVSRVKIMSGLDIADRLRPQDGRTRVSIGGRRIDLRVSTLPAATGEKVVIRILDAAGVSLRLDSLGLGRADLERVQRLVDMREGIILVTGPTGSGKTTTLYAALKTVQARGVNVVTVEDPVEYKLAGIVQVQVNERAGLTFASALRSILRQDPDVVLVGEIRDRETATIAIQASLTGHLVLSTLHTIDASSSVARLLDIGIESYKIGAALKGVVSQRLVRRLCPRCRRPSEDPPPTQVRAFIPPGSTTFRASGCDHCGNSGYRGRMALVEVLVADEEVERCISNGEGIERISEAARAAGMRSLWHSGVDHILAGSTDVDELLRVVEVPATTGPRTSPLRRSASRSVGARMPHSAPVPLTEGRRAETSVPAPSRHHHLSVGERSFDLLDEPGPETDGRSQPRVVLALGDRELGATMSRELETHGYRVAEAPDGVAALAEADRLAPDVIVLDLQLQGLDASVLLARLGARLHPPPPPVIVLAPGADEESEVGLLEAGATDVQIGPASVRRLSARIRALVSRSVRA